MKRGRQSLNQVSTELGEGHIAELLLLAVITYIPFGNHVFGTAPLPVWILGPLALGAVILLFAEEVRKHLAQLVRGRPSIGQ